MECLLQGKHPFEACQHTRYWCFESGPTLSWLWLPHARLTGHAARYLDVKEDSTSERVALQFFCVIRW
jgi:hypothetical protein